MHTMVKQLGICTVPFDTRKDCWQSFPLALCQRSHSTKTKERKMGQDWEKKEQTDLYAYRHRKVKNKTKKNKKLKAYH